jgi:hypothetical protein
VASLCRNASSAFLRAVMSLPLSSVPSGWPPGLRCSDQRLAMTASEPSRFVRTYPRYASARRSPDTNAMSTCSAPNTKVGRLILDEIETENRNFGEKSGLFESGLPNRVVYDYSGARPDCDDALFTPPYE